MAGGVTAFQTQSPIHVPRLYRTVMTSTGAAVLQDANVLSMDKQVLQKAVVDLKRQSVHDLSANIDVEWLDSFSPCHMRFMALAIKNVSVHAIGNDKSYQGNGFEINFIVWCHTVVVTGHGSFS